MSRSPWVEERGIGRQVEVTRYLESLRNNFQKLRMQLTILLPFVPVYVSLWAQARLAIRNVGQASLM